MKRLTLSPVITADVEGDRSFFARKVRAFDFEGLMDPIIGFDHFELTRDVFGPHPHAGMSAISYVFEHSAPYRSIDSRANDVTITPGSLLWTFAGKGVVHTEFPVPDGAEVEGLQLFLNMPLAKKNTEPQSVFIDKSQMPEIIEDGVRVKVVCGSSGEKNNPIATPDPLVILHVFVEPRKSFTHVLPANWSGTVLVVEGRCDVMLPEETVELDEGNVVSFGRSEIEEAITFNGITDSEVIFISGVPLNEKIFSQGAMAMGSQETLLQTLSDFKSGKMGNVTVEDGERKVIPPVEV